MSAAEEALSSSVRPELVEGQSSEKQGLRQALPERTGIDQRLPMSVVRPARAADLSAVVALLTECGLPSSDLDETSMAHFHVAEAPGRLLGVAGLDVVAPFGLLRSVAVAPDSSGIGLARWLVAAVESAARASGLVALYMIAKDQSAAAYFASRDYLSVPRTRVPEVLLALPEFNGLCPQTSPCLHKVLDGELFKTFKELQMKRLEVFDPAMCCSTGVCGVDVDPVLVQFAADLQWLGEQGVEVKRYNLGQEPQSFAANAAVLKEMEAGMERLPIIVVDGQIVTTGAYLSRLQLAQKLGLKFESKDKPHIKIGSACCSPKSGCC